MKGLLGLRSDGLCSLSGSRKRRSNISQLVGRLLRDEVPAGNADGAKVESPAAPDVGSVPELCLVLASDEQHRDSDPMSGLPIIEVVLAVEIQAGAVVRAH